MFWDILNCCSKNKAKAKTKNREKKEGRFCGFFYRDLLALPIYYHLEITCWAEECKETGRPPMLQASILEPRSPPRSHIHPITPQNAGTWTKKNQSCAGSSWKRVSAPTRKSVSSPTDLMSSEGTIPPTLSIRPRSVGPSSIRVIAGSGSVAISSTLAKKSPSSQTGYPWRSLFVKFSIFQEVPKLPIIYDIINSIHLNWSTINQAASVVLLSNKLSLSF